VSGLVWLCTFGLFGVGWVIDLFLLPEFVEEHNKKVFHQQMLETGTTLLFDGEYVRRAPRLRALSAPAASARHRASPRAPPSLTATSAQGQSAPYYPPQATPAFGNQAPYASHVYYPQPQAGGGKGGAYDGSYY
jgi:hypothetical protein